MNRITLTLKRPFIWLSRFRHRCGYGVHSPFAFNLITQVIYESTPYYKYKDLAVEQKKLAPQKDNYWKYESKKVKRLLFRLVNYIQPDTIVDAGRLAASSLYLKAGKEGADYTAASELSELFLEAGVPVGFLYLHDYGRSIPYLCSTYLWKVGFRHRRNPLYFANESALETYATR